MAIHMEVVAELERRSVQRTAAELEKSFDQYNVPIGADVKASEIKAAAEKVRREFSDIRAEIKLDMDKTIGSRLGDVKRGINDVENAAKGATNIIQELGKTSFQAARGLIAIGAPVAVAGLIELAQVGTAATQALWLLPAAAAAAGAGIGTLAMATHGFGDALKHMGDAKKWAEDLQALSPAAQQAALEIKHLVDGPLGALQNATQEAFFKGLPEQIDRLVTTYLPSIEKMTTGIATAFNQMMTGVGNQLMTPETQASLQTMFTNITTAFQNLAPAAAPFTKALTDIATVGSGFLPGLATSLANAAQNFSTFISNARESGQLAVWIQQGIDAVHNLATALGEIVQIWYRVFGPEPKASIDSNIAGVSALKETVNSYNADLTKTADIIGLLTGDTSTWAAKWNEEMVSMQGPLGGLRDAILDIPEAMAWVVNKAIDMANGVNHAINSMAENATNAFSWLPGDQKYTPIPDIPHVGAGGDWGGYQDTRGIFGNDQTGGQTPLGGDPNAQRNRRGAPPLTANNAPPIGQFPVPPPPPEGGAGGDKARRDAIIAGLDPKTWQVDPFAGMPPALPIGARGGPGASTNQEFIEGQRNIISEAHDLEEATKNRLALEKDNTASAEEISDAKWKEVEEGWQLQEAQQKLIDKMQGTTKDTKSGMDELTAALDPDLGLSKGLSGLADNLVRFLGAAALAGPMAQLNQIKNQNEAATGISGGFGLFGIQGAQNLAAGNSPLLGNPLGSPAGAATGGYGTIPSYGAGVNTTGAAMPSNLRDTGSVASGPQSRTAAAFIEQMFPGQLRGPIGGSRDNNTAKGTHDAGLSIDIPIGPDQKALGDQINAALQANADALGLKYSIWQGKGQYPGGGGFNQGGHFDHVDAHFNGQPSAAAAAGMPTGGGGLPGSLYQSGGQWRSSLPGWDHLIQRESSGVNQVQSPSTVDVNTGGNEAEGLFQITPKTWAGAGGTKYAPSALSASPQQQAEIAANIFGRNPSGSDWGMGLPGRENAGQLSGELQGWTPGSGIAGGGSGTSPIMPAVGPGLGGGAGMGIGGGYVGPGLGSGLGASTSNPTPLGGLAPPAPNPGGGGVGITPGGTIDTAIDMAASAFPGVGQAAATGMKLASRAIKYGGQMAGIGVEGLMQTFLPSGGSELANNSWLTRIVGGLAGASPALPNIAGGKSGGGQPQSPLTPEQAQAGANGQQPGVGGGLNIGKLEYNNVGATEDRAGADLGHHLGQVAQAPMGGMGTPR